MSRAKLEDIVGPVISRCEKPIKQAFKDAKMKPGDVDKVILVGGPTRMPTVQKAFEKFVGVSEIGLSMLYLHTNKKKNSE